MQGTEANPNIPAETGRHGAAKTSARRGPWADVLGSLLGKTVTIVNSESYEEAPVGHQIRAAFYPARPVAIGEDYLVISTEFVHLRHGGEKESMRQYIPLARIKRVSVMKSGILVHL